MERAYSPAQLNALLTQKINSVKNLLTRKSPQDLTRFNTALENANTTQEKIAVCENWLNWYA